MVKILRNALKLRGNMKKEKKNGRSDYEKSGLA